MVKPLAIKCCGLACHVEPRQLKIVGRVKHLFQTSSSDGNYYIYELPEGLGMRKILAHGYILAFKRMHKPGRTFSGFSQIFVLCGSKVLLAVLCSHRVEISSMVLLTLKFFWNSLFQFLQFL